MSFALEHTHISGGTFNNVTGNMSQVNNSYVAMPAGQRVIGGAQRLLSTVGGSTGVVRAQRAGRQIRSTHRPYDIPAHRLICAPEAGWSGVADTEGPADGLRIMANSASFQNPSSGFAGYGENIPNHPQTFNSIGGDMNQVNVTSYGESGLDTLYPFVAMEALHNSGERFQEPACHPGTRTAVLSKLHAWSLNTSTESQLLWLHGSAGMGKSAIAQMFAGECANQGRLGASFFFRRGHPKRGTWHNLITTIAYQLATSVPELLGPIQQAVERDKLVVGRALAVQFQQILAQSFGSAPASQFLPIIILDGLDECNDLRVQQHILSLFIGAIRSGEFLARILICSRPEPHLQEVVQTPQTFGICCELVLSADHAAYADIRTYLCNEFSRIHSKLAARGINLGVPWPTSETLEHLVEKSSGVFIYATTVISFVDDEYSHPWDRLESVLRLDPHSTAPLDDLYTQILSVLPHNQQSLRILHTIWPAFGDVPPCSPWAELIALCTTDPRRAAGLYHNPHDIAEEAMILYISRVKEVLLGTSDLRLYGEMLSYILEQCPTSSKLLYELQSLDLRQLCDHHAANEESHRVVHQEFLYPSFLNSIVDWLQKFPDPPLHAIAFWESQIAGVKRCIEINNFY
ncbi:hypothetical protein B0H11DRAFT_2224968 [Mycena galericulata]|nr:hypothetical protein B0H11DRAFT_2224968 [Mycena galericulata]